MDKIEKYKKIRSRFELISFIIALIIADRISYYLEIGNNKFFLSDSVLNLGIYLVVALILYFFAVRIADLWYKKNMDK
jgi:hypothetical protein